MFFFLVFSFQCCSADWNFLFVFNGANLQTCFSLRVHLILQVLSLVQFLFECFMYFKVYIVQVSNVDCCWAAAGPDVEKLSGLINMFPIISLCIVFPMTCVQCI